ncbi:hypothetical protein FOL47_001886, partial [Perkinsus chesapeaki]
MSCSDLCTILWSRCIIADKEGDPGLIKDVEDLMMEMKRKGYDLPSVPPLFRLLKGISTLPSTTALIDSALDDLAMSVANDNNPIRRQLQAKQVNFLLYSLTEGKGIVGGYARKWQGRRRLLEVMMPVVGGYINEGDTAFTRDTAVSCLRAYARSCTINGISNEMTYLTKELIRDVTPWIQKTLNDSDTLPITWLTNMLFIYSSSSETCFDYKSEATPMVLSRIVAMLEAQRFDIAAVKCVDIISYMSRVGIVSDVLLDYCITNSVPSGRLLRAVCKLGITFKQLEVLLGKEGLSVAVEDWVLPMAIAFMEGEGDTRVMPGSDMIELCRTLDRARLTDDAILGLYILKQCEGFNDVVAPLLDVDQVASPPPPPRSPTGWALEAAGVVGDGAVPGFIMDNGYRVQLAIPSDRISIRLVQPKGYVLQREDMAVRLSARYRARVELMRRLGWKEICLSAMEWISTDNAGGKLALIMHERVS